MLKIMPIKVVAIILTILVAFTCNSKKNKKDTLKTEIRTHESIVKEILTTSPRYKQLTEGLYEVVVKNGGTSIGISLDGSPDPKKDRAGSYSKTYDFTLYEMYSERRMNTTRFSFNPDNKQLYEYDAVNEQLNPIEFDKNLLLEYEGLLK